MDWDLALPRAVQSLNSGIVAHLGVSPSEVLIGTAPSPMAASAIDPKVLSATSNVVDTWFGQLTQPTQHAMAVRRWLNYRVQTHDQIRQLSERKKEEEATRYNRGVKEAPLDINDMVMLHQKSAGKLEPRWRGPFRIAQCGDHEVSYQLVQLSGRKIRGMFHGDHLKRFIPRTGHLIGLETPAFPTTQPIRRPRKKKVPEY